MTPLAFLGLLLSTAWHLGTLFGRDPFGQAGMYLFLGIFVVFMPTLSYLQKHQGSLQTGGWKVLLPGAPAWLALTVKVVWVYAILNFILGMVGLYDMSADFSRAASSHAMAFYVSCWGIGLAAVRRDELGIEWKCQNGHDISAEARFCEKCGAPARRPRGSR